MSIYNYEQAFGAWDRTSAPMRRAIQRWFSMYYDASADTTADTCQRIPYTVVNKLVKSVFGEYEAKAKTPFGQSVLESLNEKKRLALQLALVGGACYLKPCPSGAGFSFTLVPRNQLLIFGRDSSGNPTDVGLVEKHIEGNYFYTLLERRTVDAHGFLTISNRLYRSRDGQNLGAEVPLKNVPAYCHLAESYCFQKPVGSIGLIEVKLPILNCVDGSCDGVSVYAAAEGLINNINQNEAQMNGEFSRGESRIIASKDLLDGENGLQDHLFVGLDEDPERVGLTIFSPNLREDAYISRKQEYLRDVESLIGLRRGMLSDANVQERTATEITASAAEFSLTVLEFQRMWQQALEKVMRLCEILGELYGYAHPTTGELTVDWGNGTLYDQEKIWADYMEMVSKGILKPEVALAWRFGLAGENEQAIREKLMPQN
ncbi:MAG: phage portal protein [Oscillospiraceae bacterium]|nr:phage portal protein [Oscillospiraceae bacterium]